MDLLQALSSLLGDRFAITVVGGLRGGRGAGCAGIDYRQGLSLTELVHEYQQADIVVSLSRYEGFGYTALEAMACGKPVVAFDVVGLRDVVADCETGLLAGVDDVATLAALCKRLATHPDEAEAMGRAGRVRATDWFGKSAAVEAYIELYRSLVR
jgi:glycosyltransferase involved in cell wall biosynthesis